MPLAIPETDMHTDDIAAWRHAHRFETGAEEAAEHRTRIVMGLTLATMVAEIVAGTLFNSMALLADGWHMSTHAGALGIAAFAYAFTRRRADDDRFTFGTGKVGALAAFASAIILAMVALMVVWESAHRLTWTQTIAFDQALLVAVLGLAVNVVSAVILGGHGHHDHHDHNLRAAYLHVVADAFTSLLAIAALLLGKVSGWWWMDPLMGIIGAAVILKWAWRMMRGTGAVLLDHCDDRTLQAKVRAAMEGDADNRVTDLHLWQIGPGHWAAIVSVITDNPRAPAHYKALLMDVHEFSHVSIEVQPRRVSVFQTWWNQGG
jgi:cation diffusion facilitator family transporter